MKNINFFWRRKQDKQAKNTLPSHFDEMFKNERRLLSKKLNEQRRDNNWVHEMDDDMFENVCKMLDSDLESDISVAREIILNSKVEHKHIMVLINNRKYCINTLYPQLERPVEVAHTHITSSYWSI